MTLSQSINNEPYFLDLSTIVKILLSKKKIIITISLFICIASIIYVSFKPTYYQSQLLLKIQNTQLNSSINKNMNVLDPVNMHDPVSIQLALLKSDFILQSVIEALQLNIQVAPKNTLFKDNHPIVIQQFNVPTRLLNKKLELVIKNATQYQLYDVKKKLLLNGEIGKISTDPSHRVSLKIDELTALPGSEFILTKKPDAEIIKNLRYHLTISDLSNSGDNNENSVAIIQLSLTDKNPQFVLDMLNKIALITQNNNIHLKYLQADKTLAFLQQELPILKKSLENAEQLLNEYRASNGRVNVELQTSYLINHLSNLDKELENIRIKKTNLLQQYTYHHPMIIALNEEQIEIEKQRASLAKQLRQLPASNQEDVNLMRDVKIKNDLYVQLLNEIHQLQVNKAGIVSDVQILSPATLPEVVPQTQKLFIAIVSLFVGLFVGCSSVLFWKLVIQRHSFSTKQ